MKHLIFFVSLWFTSCHSNKEWNQLYTLHQKNNSLYITARGSNDLIKIAEGSLAVSSFLRAYDQKIKLKGYDEAELKSLYEFYKFNHLDTSDCIFYLKSNLWNY